MLSATEKMYTGAVMIRSNDITQKRERERQRDEEWEREGGSNLHQEVIM